MKRKRGEDAASTNNTARHADPTTPSKKANRVPHSSSHEDATYGSPTPTKVKSSLRQAATPSKDGTPRKQARFADSSPRTPTVRSHDAAPASTPHQANRSARRKSARLLMRHAEQGEESDAEDSRDELLAHEIFDENGGDGDSGTGTEGEADAAAEEGQDEADEDELGQAIQEDGLHPETPTKRSRGRPKGSRKQRTPTPPPDLPPHEQYFFAHRPGGSKTSDNTLPASALATHEEYYEALRSTDTPYKDPHESSFDFLHALHSRSFDQWMFELAQGYSICLYGYGSKRELLLDFAGHVASSVPNGEPERPVVVINGYNASLTPRDILHTLSTGIPSLAAPQTKLSAHPKTLLNQITTALARNPPTHPLTLILHNIDGPSLRKNSTQSLLAHLASSHHINLIASADNPNFGLLWDVAIRQQFNWVFHDATTFQPYDVEIEGGGAAGAKGQHGVVDSANALLGRSGRKIQGREGVMYVLKSLTQSARSLYALLLGELLGAADEGDGDGGGSADELNDEAEGFDGRGDDAYADGDDDDDDSEHDEPEALQTPSRRNNSKARHGHKRSGGTVTTTLPLRTLYTLSTHQFIATSEMAFRGLLKEFTDHEMVVLRRDVLGVEVVGVPFKRGEVESLILELAGGGGVGR